MGVVQPTTETEIRKAGRIAANAELLSIQLLQLELDNNLGFPLPDWAETSDHELAWRSGDYEFDPETGLLKCVCTFILKVKQGDEKTGNSRSEAINVSLGIAAFYKLPRDIPEDVGEKHFKAFAKTNAIFNCWPYIRQLVASLGTAALFPITLPVFRVQIRKKGTKTSKVPNSKERAKAQVEVRHQKGPSKAAGPKPANAR